VHLGTKFCENTINTCEVICEYSRKITPICCHSHRVNHIWQEAENWYSGRLTIEQGIELKTIKYSKKIIITRSRITNKMPLLTDKSFGRINRKLVRG